jgi:biopolymer transport protein ExbD
MNEFAEINITPFTDVILVLLIIFMITSPFLISGAFHVKLPTSVASETQVNQSVEVFLTEKNEIIINNNKIDAANFAGTLQAEFQKRNNFDVIIKADKNVLHGNFVRMLDLIKLSGAQKILVATTKATDKK